jgi:GT2 family glycosyltransferase
MIAPAAGSRETRFVIDRAGQDRSTEPGELVTSPEFRPSAALSIVLVSYDRPGDLLACLETLDRQEHRDFEVIVVDNGRNEPAHDALSRYPVRWLRMTENRGVTRGRNVGTAHASGEVVAFLDDDCLAAPDLTHAFSRAFRDRAIYAVRGRVLPKTGNGYNVLAYLYDRGDRVFPFLLNTETVMAVRRDRLEQVGGWNEEIWGHEGAELSLRLARRYGREGMVYYPDAVVRHDYADGLRKLLRKDLRHLEIAPRLEQTHPGLADFVASYTRGGGGGDIRVHPEHLGFMLRYKMGAVRRLRVLIRNSAAARRIARALLG